MMFIDTSVKHLPFAPYTTKTARIRCYTMPSTIKCQDAKTYKKCVRGGVFRRVRDGVRGEAMQTPYGL